MKRKLLNFFCAREKRFLCDETGTASIEVVLWLPLFFGAFVLVADVAMIFHGQAQVLRVVQDANRNLSVGQLTSVTETEDFIKARLLPMAPNAVANTSVNAGLIVSTATVPVQDLELIGLFRALSSANIRVSSEQLIEF